MALLQSYEFWVGAGLVAFVLILVAVKVPALLAKMLDDTTAKIQHELDEAQKLRSEAQALLASIKTQRDEAEHQAATMLTEAEAADVLFLYVALLQGELTLQMAVADGALSAASLPPPQEIDARFETGLHYVIEGILAARTRTRGKAASSADR